MRLLYNSAIAVFAGVLILASCSSTPSKDAEKGPEAWVDKPIDTEVILKYDPKNGDKRIDAFFKHLHKVSGFNGNILVAKKGKIIYQNALGWADYLHRDSLKINSKFELASVSKTMTGTAIMQLWERGKIKLDQDVRDFFPDFPYEGVTIRLLLTHRSGMMNYVYFTERVYKQEHLSQRKGLTNAEAMALIAKYKPARYNIPNKSFHYNNSNYMVLAAIIEKVTGKLMPIT